MEVGREGDDGVGEVDGVGEGDRCCSPAMVTVVVFVGRGFVTTREKGGRGLLRE